MKGNLIFSIVIEPLTTKFERFIGLFLVAFIFIPFSYGIFTQQGLYCLSLPFVFFGILTFNHFTSYKFTTPKIIQENKFISFDEEDVFKILDNQIYTSYNFNEVENLEIKLIAFRGKWRDENDFECGKYDGIENYVSFSFRGAVFKYLFYIETLKEFNFLSDYLEEKVLPNLYTHKRIKDENIIISKLNYKELQTFKAKYNINRYTDFIHFN